MSNALEPVVDNFTGLVKPETFDVRVNNLKPEIKRELGIKLNPLVIMEQMMVKGYLNVDQAIDVCKTLAKYTHSTHAFRLNTKRQAATSPEDWVQALEAMNGSIDDETGEIFVGAGPGD
jgi:hypothetical protein